MEQNSQEIDLTDSCVFVNLLHAKASISNPEQKLIELIKLEKYITIPFLLTYRIIRQKISKHIKDFNTN